MINKVVLIIKNQNSRETAINITTNHCKEITVTAKINFDFTTEIHRATDFLFKNILMHDDDFGSNYVKCPQISNLFLWTYEHQIIDLPNW